MTDREESNRTIRQPIVTVAGHVDHGKTSILDSIRSTCVAKKEAGGITQKISFTYFPYKLLQDKCHNLLEKLNIKLEIPGFLFIDTPGHAAFTNLRKRGGSLADLAILVIDINEGFMPQTSETIQILKASKVPFIIALNKIDSISGWVKESDELREDIEKQKYFVKEDFEIKLLNIIGTLQSNGFDADLYYNLKDFTKKIALVPCSAKTGEGIPDLLVMLSGLSQKFLKEKLVLGKTAKGTILEVKKEKVLEIEAILYDGKLKVGDEIMIASLEEPFKSKVKAIFSVLPLGKGYEAVDEITAAAGIRLNISSEKEILPGMPFTAITKEAKEEKLKQELKEEISEEICCSDKYGIIIKAESLGSLEALIFLLKQKNISFSYSGIGDITKQDIAKANSIEDPVFRVILGFNVKIDKEFKEEERKVIEKTKIITNEVIYKLIEDYEKFRKEKQLELERKTLESLTMPCKIKILPYVFRNSNPAVFGISVLVGTIKHRIRLMDENGEKVGEIKGIQSENKSIEKAEKDMEVAISMPGIVFDRHLKKGQILYSDLNEEDFKELKNNKNFLTKLEISILQEIANIKRKKIPTWGI